MSKKVFFWFLFMLFGKVQLSYAEYFSHLGLSDGLSSPSVMAIYQDCLGRMWFGTREGINVYDGNRISVYQGWVQNGKNAASPIWLGNEVSSIAGDREGDIYILIDRKLIKYDIRKGSFDYFLGEEQVSALTSFDGEIWYAKQDSLFCLKNGEDQARYVLKVQTESLINHLNIQAKSAYISTSDGAFIINRQTHERQQVLKGTDIYSIFESSRKELWIGTRIKGLYRMTTNGQIHPVPYLPHSSEGVSSNQIREFVEDNEGNIWFGTFDGLHKYAPTTKTYKLIQIPKYRGGLTHPSIFSLYKDVQGTIWIGSYFGGVNYFTPQHTDFAHYNYMENAQTHLSYSYIGDLISDKDNHLWFGTDGGGICCVDEDWNILKQLTAEQGNALPHNNIKGICYDKEHNSLYIGTYLGGLSRYDLNTGRFHNYLQESHTTDLPNNVVFHVKIHQKQLYLTARNGVFRLDIPTQQFHKLPIPNAYYEHFDIDKEGNMYLIAWNKLVITHVAHPDSIIRIPLTVKGHQTTANKVLATPQGAYITTLGSGLIFYDKQKHETTRFTAQLPNGFCYNLCLTPDGRILVTHSKGVSCFAPDTKTFITLDFMHKFPSAHIINGCGIYAASDGQIYMGDTEGVTSFHENEFLKSQTDTPYTHFYFSELWINNHLVSPNDETKVLSEVLPYTRQLKLNHQQNSFTIRFTYSNYKEQLSEKWFMYKLEGFDKQWIPSKQPELNYTNLNPGKYTLRITATDEYGGQRSSDELQMHILISTPWYVSWWAWTIYILTIVSCVSYFIASRIARRTLALSLEKERFEKQQAEQLNKEKLVFFTNVSHEFRTPLTLIISHIDLLLRSSMSPTTYNSILKIRKNAQHMNNLISELLEFRKLEQNQETIRLKHLDIRSFLKEIYLSFADYANQRQINYRLELPEAPTLCWFDPRLMEKVFFNLLSNAFKYTADKGEITLSGEITDTEISIHITDTGIGISKQDTGLIFNRFYQGENPKEMKDVFKGTGIGLALTKNIVEKHHGEITVESTLGKGSTFTVRLPLAESAFLQDPNIQLSAETEESGIIHDPLPPICEENGCTTISDIPAENAEKPSYTVLLVEDNEELLSVLEQLFAPFYKVICAHNGKEGLNLVYKEKPDLVISDIMMPEMTGTEMCLQIKNNIDFCHIPIILLTALNSPEYNLEGLNRGADDYITKPFHAQLLLARANNLIRNRLLIQRQFNKKPITEIDLTSINPLDQNLLKRATQIIEKHIDDIEFDIPVLCKEVGVSRSLLYVKFKALTGMTPNNFILNCRLQHAAVLLQKYPNLSISEISDQCGFSTSVYFSRCFKNLYECTPTEYQKKKQQTAPNGTNPQE